MDDIRFIQSGSYSLKMWTCAAKVVFIALISTYYTTDHGCVLALSFVVSRRAAITVATTTATWFSAMELARAAGADTQIDGSFNVDEFLRTGIVAQPMGVSGQSGTYEIGALSRIVWIR
jgi:hypothetical protein